VRRALFATFLVCIVFATAPLFSQSSDASASSTSAASSASPEPYREDEFPLWLRDLRRAEIVFVGSVPITLLVATLAYDGFRSGRDIVMDVQIGERSEFGSFTNDERKWLLASGLTLSGVVSIIDFLVELRLRREAARPTE
jgi:hypothetical protein